MLIRSLAMVASLTLSPIALASTPDPLLAEAGPRAERFAHEVGGVALAEEYQHLVFDQVRNALKNGPVKDAQYIFFVDRNPEVQRGVLLLVDPVSNRIFVIGADRVSTGNPKRKGFFVTPLGFHAHTPENLDYRALGTKNAKGWRGLGARGSRVWDFGWRETQTRDGQPYQIRLLLHATDPDFGEPRLGTVDSKGCVRISGSMNRFLDRGGILDRGYDETARTRAVLSRSHESTPYAGKYLLVGDSRY